MTSFYSDILTTQNGPNYGQPVQNRSKVNKLGGRLRYFEAMYQAPASGTAPAIADKIYWGKLPLGARIIPHLSELRWTTGTASCTMNMGDSIVAARHLAATAVTTAGSVALTASAISQTGTGNITTGSTQITTLVSVGAFQVGYNITGTGIPLGAYITAVDKVGKTCTISAAATATTATLAITTNGGGYETTDDSNNLGNLFAGTLDDATLVSTVAGAQVANNQVFVLKIAYVQD
jgi:hypothetical protein